MQNQKTLTLMAAWLLIIWSATASSTSQILYVDDDAVGADDGSSWANAFRYLQDALAIARKAESPVEIRIAQGLYRPDQSREEIPSSRSVTRPGPVGPRRDFLFNVSHGITLAGGYAGLGAVDPNACDPASYVTILSGDLDGNDEPGIPPCDLTTHPSRQDNAYTVVLLGQGDAVGPITGVQIEGASETALLTSGPFPAWNRLLVSDCVFRDNSGVEGGAVKINGGDVTFVRCTFTENWAQSGGAMCFTSYWDWSVDVESCHFCRNYANQGGAIAANTRSMTIRNSILAGNVARESGGAILSRQPLAIAACTFVGNRAREGSALACITDRQWPAGDKLTIADCILRDGGGEISNRSENRLDVMYCNVEGDWPGARILDVDPCFAEPGRWDANNTPDDPNDDTWIDGDYHLKSQAGRWNPASRTWVHDATTSPCIDSGDVYSPYDREPWPHGCRSNLGAYANTPEASLSPASSGGMADLNDDGIVDIDDLAPLVDRWLDQGPLIAEDLNRDEKVSLQDFDVLASQWLAERTEFRFAEYWPLIPGNRWANLPTIRDWGCEFEVTDRFAVNGFDIIEVENGFLDRLGVGSSHTRYRVYVDGALYGTFDRSALDRLPEVSDGFTREWPEVVRNGQPLLDYAGSPLTPVRMTFRQLAALFDDRYPMSILTLYPPEDRNLDILAFTAAAGNVIEAFGRGYGPILEEGFIWMTRTPNYRWYP
ncbi:MAG: hypothetical protein ACM3VT_21050 [Solirubrobacterales bacterium]